MKNKNIPSNTELPSMGRLIKSTVLAICIAAIILVTIVLPAEYGIDPTGIGDSIGLLKMGEIKVSLAEEAALERINQKPKEATKLDNSEPKSESKAEIVSSPSKADVQSDEITFSLSPNEGKEIKLTMKKGEKVNYTWWTDGGRANYDIHADSEILQINYHNYEKGSLERSDGLLEAAFEGNHGWFWRNRTTKTMKVTLQVSGEYTEVKQI